MNDNQNEYEELIKIIKALPQAEPPAGMMRRVMGKIEQREKEYFFALRRRISLILKEVFDKPQTKEACAVSFIALGFFYLVASMILFLYIKDINGTSGLYDWLKYQPSIFILVSFWLVLVGAIIWTRGGKAARFAHIGSYIYISIFVIGGLLVSFGGKVELLFALILSLGALITGISLDAAVNRLANEIKIEG